MQTRLESLLVLEFIILNGFYGDNVEVIYGGICQIRKINLRCGSRGLEEVRPIFKILRLDTQIDANIESSETTF